MKEKNYDFTHEEDGRHWVECRSEAAWEETIAAVREYGNYVSVKFPDPIIHTVIENMGGWHATGDWMGVDLLQKKREFEMLYLIIKKRGGYCKHPAYLPGLHEIDNKARGWNVKPQIEKCTF